MSRGEKITWEDKIVITRGEDSHKIKIIVEGLWTGRDRAVISRTLHREMRRAAHIIIQKHKEADLLASQGEEVKEVKEVKLSKIEIMAKARAAKKLKKELEEGK